VVVITGVCLVIGGAHNADRETVSKNIFAFFCLMMQPIMIAGGYIALRKMKNNHTMVVSAYTNLALMVVSFIVIIFGGIGFEYIS
jgi:hypothetical protein